MERGIVSFRPFCFVRRVFYDVGAITPGLDYSCICFILHESEIIYPVAFPPLPFSH